MLRMSLNEDNEGNELCMQNRRLMLASMKDAPFPMGSLCSIQNHPVEVLGRTSHPSQGET